MAKTVIALHDEAQSANRSVRELVENGFFRDDISLVTPAAVKAPPSKEVFPLFIDDLGRNPPEPKVDVVDELRKSLDSLESIRVPGIGQVYAAGPLAAQLSIHSSPSLNTASKGLMSGLLGALLKVGVPEERAHYYAEGIRRGWTLVMVKTPDYRAREAVDIINRYKPVDINQRAREWRLAGWTGYKGL
jgi:hypothetical protein